MRRLNKEIVSKDKLIFIESQMKVTPLKNVFKKIQLDLLHKAMKGCEKSKELLAISRKHSQQLVF